MEPDYEREKREGGKPREQQIEKQAPPEGKGVGDRENQEGETPVATTDGGFWSWFRRRH